MPRKSNKKVSKKEDPENDIDDMDDEVEIDDIDNELNDDELLDDSEEDEDDDYDDDEPNKKTGDHNENTCDIEDAIEEDDIYFNNDEETEIPTENEAEYVSKENRVSVNRLTKYEMVRILGERTKQLTMGAKPLLKNYKDLTYEKIAEEEFKLNMTPFKIKRPLPNGKFEIWTLDELNKDHLMSLL
jgi:DNA-directed RNA polymerase subunit K/omega